MDREYWRPEREAMPLDDLWELQDKRVQSAVKRGYNAPIVRELWDEAGVSPHDISGTADLAEAPVFRKDNARQRQLDNPKAQPFGGRLQIPLDELMENDGAAVYTSSGTTGTPTNIVFSDRDQHVRAETFARCLWEYGLRPGGLYPFWAPSNHPASDQFRLAAKKIGAGFTSIPISPDEVPRFIHLLRHFDVSVAMIVLAMIDAVDHYMDENDLDPKEEFSDVKSIVTGGEPMLESKRQSVEERWGVDVLEFSGGSEPGWYPFETLDKGRWLQVSDDHFYVEAVDPETGERVADGERGELVVTSLTQEALAFIRWAHDDIVEIKRGEFPDGRTGTRVKFLGRVGDLIRVGETDILPLDALKVVDPIEQMPQNLFQFYTDSSEHGELRLRIGYDKAKTSDPEAVSEEVKTQLEANLEVPVNILEAVEKETILEMGPPHKIPRVIE